MAGGSGKCWGNPDLKKSRQAKTEIPGPPEKSHPEKSRSRMIGCNVRSRQNFVCTYIEKDFFTSQVTRHYYWSKFKGINIIRGNGAFVFSPPKFLRLLAFVENLGFSQKPNFLRLVFARKFRPHINKIQKINKNFTKNC